MFCNQMKRRTTKKIHNQHGFTIMEILIAMAIFGIGILGVAKMQISAITGNTSARIHSEASAIAQEQIESLMALSYTDIGDTGAACTIDYVNPVNVNGYEVNCAVLQETDINGDGNNDIKFIQIVVNDPRGKQRSDITFAKAAGI
jgi:type IV pilus modification protein PilV